MKLYIFILLFLSLFGKDTQANKKTFEGVITYKVKTEILKPDKYSEYLKEKYGTSMKFYWNDKGDLLRQTFGNENGLDYSLYINSENIFYNKYKGIDTLYYYKGSENDDEIIEIKETKAELILNQKCKRIKIKAKNKKFADEYTMEYYYSGKPHINYKLYKNINDGFANILYKKAKSPFLKFKLTFDKFCMTYTAEKIEQKKIDDVFFVVDNSLPKKEY